MTDLLDKRGTLDRVGFQLLFDKLGTLDIGVTCCKILKIGSMTHCLDNLGTFT